MKACTGMQLRSEAFLKVIPLILGLFLTTAISSAAQQDSVFTGTASYYANKFEGRRTSSGEVFRQDSLTAAHKYLPFGTRVIVTNLSNDSTIVVRINDRLPATSRRVIDLSLSAARQLNFVRQGLTKVSVALIREKREDEPAIDE